MPRPIGKLQLTQIRARLRSLAKNPLHVDPLRSRGEAIKGTYSNTTLSSSIQKLSHEAFYEAWSLLGLLELWNLAWKYNAASNCGEKAGIPEQKHISCRQCPAFRDAMLFCYIC